MVRRVGEDVHFLRRQRGAPDQLVVAVAADDHAAVLALLRLVGMAAKISE